MSSLANRDAGVAALAQALGAVAASVAASVPATGRAYTVEVLPGGYIKTSTGAVIEPAPPAK